MSLDARTKEASQALNACMLSEWRMCVAGVMLGMVPSMRYKTFWPFVIGGVSGSIFDWRNGKKNCVEFSDALEAIVREKEALAER